MSKVPKVKLGSSGLVVSKLGFGTFDFGVRSLGIVPEEGCRILSEAHRLGVSFWDTSDDYGSHPHIAAALRVIPRKRVVISTKTSAKSGEEAGKSLRIPSRSSVQVMLISSCFISSRLIGLAGVVEC